MPGTMRGVELRGGRRQGERSRADAAFPLI